eukprot:TRINITY_DN30599_c0_g1_i1.p1 TRINITY_DN30599_c0_g1~~TRINITY_DN30599_c0_g1_i1.p1  ORF type:complete len:550 (+),score=103.69 TRINITY_DN30599_c0_g1_i1:65-1651(+)
MAASSAVPAASSTALAAAAAAAAAGASPLDAEVAQLRRSYSKLKEEGAAQPRALPRMAPLLVPAASAPRSGRAGASENDAAVGRGVAVAALRSELRSELRELRGELRDVRDECARRSLEPDPGPATCEATRQDASWEGPPSPAATTLPRAAAGQTPARTGRIESDASTPPTCDIAAALLRWAEAAEASSVDLSGSPADVRGRPGALTAAPGTVVSHTQRSNGVSTNATRFDLAALVAEAAAECEPAARPVAPSGCCDVHTSVTLAEPTLLPASSAATAERAYSPATDCANGCWPAKVLAQVSTSELQTPTLVASASAMANNAAPSVATLAVRSSVPLAQREPSEPLVIPARRRPSGMLAMSKEALPACPQTRTASIEASTTRARQPPRPVAPDLTAACWSLSPGDAAACGASGAGAGDVAGSGPGFGSGAGFGATPAAAFTSVVREPLMAEPLPCPTIRRRVARRTQSRGQRGHRARSVGTLDAACAECAARGGENADFATTAVAASRVAANACAANAARASRAHRVG